MQKFREVMAVTIICLVTTLLVVQLGWVGVQLSHAFNYIQCSKTLQNVQLQMQEVNSNVTALKNDLEVLKDKEVDSVLKKYFIAKPK